MRSDTPSPLKKNFLCDFLNKMWADRWLNDFSDNHFLIQAMENRLNGFVGENQLKENNFNIYNFDDNFALNFSINLSTKLYHLTKKFGEPNIKHFVEDQLSAGKVHYDEDQFFRALSEISVLNYFGTFGADVLSDAVYEPPIGQKGKNPEARFIYKDGTIVDVEVKTPGFHHEQYEEKIIIPTLLLDADGRGVLNKYCSEQNIRCIFPRVYKLIDFLNSANKKFILPKEGNQFNLLYINWTYSEFPSNSFLEAYAILANPINGILTHRNIGIKMGVHENVYDKISAVIVYTDSLNGLAFQDFRYLWALRNFAIIPVNGSDIKLLRVTDMDYKRNPYPPRLMADFKSKSLDEQVEDAVHSVQILRIIGEHILQ